MRLFCLVMILMIFSVSCSKKQNTQSRLRIQFDSSIFNGESGELNKVTSSNTSGPNWGLADPTDLSQINCWAVFVGGPEIFLKTSSCTNFNDNTFMRFGPRAGFFPIGEEGEIFAPAGEDRIISLVGMASADGTCDPNFGRDPEIEASNYSNPFLLGRSKVNLANAEEVVEIEVASIFESENKIKDCDFFSPGGGDSPGLSFPSTLPYIFSPTLIGLSGTYTLTLTNTSDQPISNISVTDQLATPFDFYAGAYPGMGGNCADSLAPGSSCDLVVAFTPSETTLQSDVLTLSYEFNGATYSISKELRGQGRTPASLSISGAATVIFGPTPSGTPVFQILTLTNTGGYPATGITESGLATPYRFAGGVGYPGSGANCPVNLAPGANCTIRIEFNPGTLGTYPETLILNYNDGVSGQSSIKNLTGQGL